MPFVIDLLHWSNATSFSNRLPSTHMLLRVKEAERERETECWSDNMNWLDWLSFIYSLKFVVSVVIVENTDVNGYDGENHAGQGQRSKFIHELDANVDNWSCGTTHDANVEEKNFRFVTLILNCYDCRITCAESTNDKTQTTFSTFTYPWSIEELFHTRENYCTSHSPDLLDRQILLAPEPCTSENYSQFKN